MGQLQARFWPEYNNMRITNDALCFVYDKAKIAVLKKEELIFPTKAQLESWNIVCSEPYYLGTLDKVPCFAMNLLQGSEEAEKLRWIMLDDGEWFKEQQLYLIAIKAKQLLGWDKNSTYCGCCGSLNKRKEDERAKVCPKCGHIEYPRISPAIIVGIKRGNELLMAHNANFKEGLYSIIAGFVEQGETIEQAVQREVMEEVGLKVKNIQYISSKPWMNGDSLMLGCIAEYDEGEIQVDGKEITDAGWYTKEKLPPVLPLPITTAREIINQLLDL